VELVSSVKLKPPRIRHAFFFADFFTAAQRAFAALEAAALRSAFVEPFHLALAI
jgi:hypothetical protein